MLGIEKGVMGFSKKTVIRGVLGAAVAVSALAGTAHATVKHEGVWPATDKTISIDGEGLSRDQAIKKIAELAGWSVLVKLKDAGEPLALHVKDQPASKILDLVLSDGDYVVKRDGSIVSIRPMTDAQRSETRAEASKDDDDDKQIADDAKKLAAGAMHAAAVALSGSAAPQAPEPPEPPEPPAAPAAPVPPTPPIPPKLHPHKHHGDADRVVTGGHVTIQKDETVGDVTVLGGSLDVYGDVEGDLAVFGGESEVREGGEVHGDAVTLGGSLTIDDGADVDGDVSVIGGSLHRGDKASIGGKARDDKGEIKVSVDTDDDKSSSKEHGGGFFAHVADAMSGSALMFVFGAVLLALLTRRVDSLKVEVASRPMRSFAIGVVGSIVATIAMCALCITIVGIPLAIVGVLAAVVAVYGSMTAVLTTAGQALLAHKTTNPYMHLALGCVLFFLAALIPHVGGLVVAAVVFTAIGALVTTRVAGFVPPRTRNTPTDPYRTQATP
jgi:hypothetical protein